jgi:sugar/nucleoside kinase (ribokinase family)
LLVVGGVTLDLLHLPTGETAHTPGGAGTYVSLAANLAGADVSLFAQRPEPLPPSFQPIAASLNWFGARITAKDVPQLEIAHYGGGRAALLHAQWGAQRKLSPAQLPSDLSNYAFVHIPPIGTAQKQLEFLRACRARGILRVSVGTYSHVVRDEIDVVRQLFREADMFFLNENEANGLFGEGNDPEPDARTLTFITLGERGVRVCVPDQRPTRILAPRTIERDPTGAGDTFAGATLAHLLRDSDPIAAAQAGVQAASAMIEHVGTAYFFR